MAEHTTPIESDNPRKDHIVTVSTTFNMVRIEDDAGHEILIPLHAFKRLSKWVSEIRS